MSTARTKIFLIGWLIAASTLSMGAFHAIHISFGEAEIDDFVFKAKLTFYKDDFFKALKNWYGREFRNFTDAKYEALKRSYLENHFTVLDESNNKLVFEIISNNEDGNSIWFEIQCKSLQEINKLKLKYTALFKEYSDQMNLLNVETSSSKNSFIFSNSNPELKIN